MWKVNKNKKNSQRNLKNAHFSHRFHSSALKACACERKYSQTVVQNRIELKNWDKNIQLVHIKLKNETQNIELIYIKFKIKTETQKKVSTLLKNNDCRAYTCITVINVQK